MHSFKDTTSEGWLLSLSYGDVQRIKATLGENFLDPAAPLQRLMLDVEFAVGVGWLLCEKQAAERKLSEEDFACRLGGKSLGDMQQAILAELVDFFQGLGRTEAAEAIRKLVETLAAVRESARKQIAAESVEGIVTKAMSTT